MTNESGTPSAKPWPFSSTTMAVAVEGRATPRSTAARANRRQIMFSLQIGCYQVCRNRLDPAVPDVMPLGDAYATGERPRRSEQDRCRARLTTRARAPGRPLVQL